MRRPAPEAGRALARPRAKRPQLKRDPLGGSAAHVAHYRQPMTFVLYFLAVWLGGALLLGTPLGLLFGWIGASIARVRDRALVSSTSMSELPPIKRIARSGITLGQAVGVGVATGWWWVLGPDLDPPWLAAPLTLTALFTTNAPGFVRFARSYGAAIEGLWQVLPGVAAAWIVHKLLS